MLARKTDPNDFLIRTYALEVIWNKVSQEGRKKSGEGRNSPLKAAQQLHAKPDRHNQLNKLKNRCWQQKRGSSGNRGPTMTLLTVF
jgi:hypothetical protein